MEWMAVVKCKVSKGFTEKVKVELWHPGCLTAPCRCGREEWFLAGSFPEMQIQEGECSFVLGGVLMVSRLLEESRPPERLNCTRL